MVHRNEPTRYRPMDRTTRGVENFSSSLNAGSNPLVVGSNPTTPAQKKFIDKSVKFRSLRGSDRSSPRSQVKKDNGDEQRESCTRELIVAGL